jgi:hypothetical protein
MGAASFREMRERQDKEVKVESEKIAPQVQEQKQPKRKPRNKKIEP